jgi:hypothetical protein
MANYNTGWAIDRSCATMETLIRQIAISALLISVAVLVFMPISPVSTAVPTSTHYTWTGHTWTGTPRITTTVTVPHTHTRWNDPSPPYPWPPSGYYPPAPPCDPNNPYSTCWDPQCAPQCGYQAVVTESGTTVMATEAVTSVVTAPPSTVVITQTQPQTTMATQPSSPDYTPIAIAIVAAAVIIGLVSIRTRAAPSKLTHPSPASSLGQPADGFCPHCGAQLLPQARFCKKCGHSVT